MVDYFAVIHCNNYMNGFQNTSTNLHPVFEHTDPEAYAIFAQIKWPLGTYKHITLVAHTYSRLVWNCVQFGSLLALFTCGFGCVYSWEPLRVLVDFLANLGEVVSSHALKQTTLHNLRKSLGTY